MNLPFGAPSPPSPPAAAAPAGARCPSPRGPALHVGIACSAETVLHEDNWSLLEAFTSAGHEARIVIWNDPSIRAWSAFDCVVVRTCWTLDVSTRDALLSWLRRVNEVCSSLLSMHIHAHTRNTFLIIFSFVFLHLHGNPKQETVLVNPYEVISWNTEHRFLDELYARGVNVVPSVLVPQHEQPDAVLAAMEQRGWTEALVQPAILPEEVMQVYVATAPPTTSTPSPTHSPLASTATASTVTTVPVSLQQQQQQQQQQQTAVTVAAATESVVAAALSHDAQRNLWLKRVTELRQQVGDVLVRPFLRPVLRDGETSFVFLDGMFSHAVRRRPRAADFHATQVLALPFVEPHVPSDDALFFAVSAYTALAATVRDVFGRHVAPVFARIDVVRDAAGTLLVNSVELVDPVLFFSRAPAAARTFVAAVTAFVRTRLAPHQAQQGLCTPPPSSSTAVSFFPPIANIGAN